MRLMWYHTEIWAFTIILLAFVIFRVQKRTGFSSLEITHEESRFANQSGLI